MPKDLNPSQLPGNRRGPRSVKVMIVEDMPMLMKRCGGPTCRGEWRPVSEFHEIKPPKQRVSELTRAKDSECSFTYYSSQCKRCGSYRHRQLYQNGKWSGIHGKVSTRVMTPYLDELISKCNRSIKEVERLTGLDLSTIHHLRSEKYEFVRKENAAKILNALLIVRRPSYKAPLLLQPSRLKPSARQRRLAESDKIDELRFYTHDSEAA